MIILANGEKIAHGDVGVAISLDPLIEQVMVVGEGRPFLGALLVLNKEEKSRYLVRSKSSNGMNGPIFQAELKARIRKCTRAFPGHARVREFSIIDEAWTIENELMTPTLKLRRARVTERYANTIEELYQGHV